MRHAALIMHDETERAEELLAEGTSPFHKVKLNSDAVTRKLCPGIYN
jgi:hypothetical protein